MIVELSVKTIPCFVVYFTIEAFERRGQILQEALITGQFAVCGNKAVTKLYFGGFQRYIELSNRVLTQLKQGAHHSLFVATKDHQPELNGCFGRPFVAPPLVGCDDPPSSMSAVYSPFRCGARMHYSLVVCTVQVSSWNYGCNIPIIRFMCMVSVL